MNRMLFTGLVVGALVVGAMGGAVLTGDGADRPPQRTEEAAMAAFTIDDPTCGSSRTTNTSFESYPADDQRRVIVNTTIPVEGDGTELESDLKRLGPERFLLNIQREAGGEAMDCYGEMRYNATMHLPDHYTVIVAHDGRIRHMTLRDSEGSGGYSNVLPEEEP